MKLVVSVPKTKVRASKCSVTGFHAWVVRNEPPKRVIAGQACWATTRRIAIRARGAARLITAVTTRKLSGARGAWAGLRSATAAISRLPLFPRRPWASCRPAGPAGSPRRAP